MKYKGKKLEGRNTDILVLVRGEEHIVFKAEAIQNYQQFNEMCPLPEPPVKLLPGGIREPDLNNPKYKKRMEEYATQKTNYTVLKSLEPTQELEWEKVVLNKPESWGNWQDELQEAGFTEIEVMRILGLCTRVNCLDDSLLDEAKESFLAGARQDGR